MGIYQRSKELKIGLFLSEFSNFLPKAADKPLFFVSFFLPRLSTREKWLRRLWSRGYFSIVNKVVSKKFKRSRIKISHLVGK